MKNSLIMSLVGLLFGAVLASAQTLMLGLGDSTGEGVQSGDASYLTQQHSYQYLIARRIGANFPLPWIRSGPLGTVDNLASRSRFYPDLAGLNLAVSGADTYDLLFTRADALTPETIDSETDLVLYPRTGSQIEIAETLGAELIPVWIGNNDVLSAVISFDQLDASQMTPLPDFEARFREIATRLTRISPRVVFGNIPDVTDIAFLLNRADLIRLLGSDHGLPDGSYTSIVTLFLIKLGLASGSILNDPNAVLDAQEIVFIQQRIVAFNQVIANEAARTGATLVDINGIFKWISNNPLQVEGVVLTPKFLGGLFSLDGVHPSNIGHALIADAFVRVINARYSVQIPRFTQAEFMQIFLADPFVDKDGDGRVTGRPQAGLLETLGPLLGISGDTSDTLPQQIQSQSLVQTQRDFQRAYSERKNADPSIETGPLTREKAVRVFKEIFPPKRF